MDDLQLYILAVGVSMVVVLMICCLFLFYKCKQKMKKWLKILWKMVFFNMIIRSITIVYAKFCISYGERIEHWL